MNFINSLNDKYFTLNGVQYFRNYVSAVHGNNVEIYNCYEREDVLVSLTKFSEFTVDGSVYSSAAELQSALLEVTFSRLTTGDSAVMDQNNIGRIIATGNIGPAENVFFNASMAVANRLNTMQIIITAKQTPVIITASLLVSAGTYNYVSKRYKYLFKPGKGEWGLNGTAINSTHLELINVENYLVDDLLSEPNAIINNLGELPEGDYVTAANASSWDFTESGADGESGIKTYYFSYETNGVLYFVQFVGVPGNYGQGYTAQFTESDFVSSTDSRITDIPTLEDILEQGGNTNVSQLTNDGDGTSPYATIANVNGLNVTINQAAAELYLKNNSGTTLATVNLGFLNNEGTTFYYDVTSQKLELRNDEETVLSEIPVSAFVSNLMQSVDFNATSPQTLEFKDAQGNIAESVTFTINNIQGLQTALNSKANTDGSNASGNWPININGKAALASQIATTNAGNMNFHWLDGISAGVSSTWMWGGTNVTDMYVYSPVSFPISNATQIALDNKVNLNGSNVTGSWPISISGTAETSTTATNWSRTYVSDFNIPIGFKLLESYVSPANSPENGNWGQGIQFSTNNNPNYANQLVFDITGNLFTRTKYDSSWNSWSKIPLDQNVLHKTGDEIKSGNITIDGNNRGLYLGNAGNNASILSNNNGNLDITPRAGYDTVFTAGKIGVGKTPETKLDVNGGGSFGSGTVNAGQTSINIRNELGKTWGLISGTPNVAEDSFTLRNITDNLDILFATPNGNIGLGSYSPAAKLHISNGTGGNQLMLTRGSGGVLLGQPLNEDSLIMYNKTGTTTYQKWHQSGNISLGSQTDNGYKLDVIGNGRFTGELSILDGTMATSAVNKSQLDNKGNFIIDTVADGYISKTGNVTKSGIITFTDSPIIPDATNLYHPVTRKQLNNVRVADFVTIKGTDYTVNTADDIGQTGVITVYINATANNVTITLPGVLNIADRYTYNFKRIDNSSYIAKIISPLTIDGQTSISLGYLHSVTIKSVIDKFWIFSKYTP
ncbi:MAG: hypothetical protein DI539_00295 [Flavobacterium psychrophilum]|nr:MAG: hypothetical protein DI539_00295 [Flavobacterium psychrophilum]